MKNIDFVTDLRDDPFNRIELFDEGWVRRIGRFDSVEIRRLVDDAMNLSLEALFRRGRVAIAPGLGEIAPSWVQLDEIPIEASIKTDRFVRQIRGRPFAQKVVPPKRDWQAIAGLAGQRRLHSVLLF